MRNEYLENRLSCQISSYKFLDDYNHTEIYFWHWNLVKYLENGLESHETFIGISASKIGSQSTAVMEFCQTAVLWMKSNQTTPPQ